MPAEVEERYARAFEDVLGQEQISDPAIFLDEDGFDEVPVWSRYSQLHFLSSLPVADANRLLIRMSALYLRGIVSYAVQHRRADAVPVLRMVAVQGWLDEGETGKPNYNGSAAYLCPYILTANLDNLNLERFDVWPVTSPAGQFVRGALDGDSRFAVAEAEPDKLGAPVPERVYIYVPGSEATDRLRMRTG